MTGLSRAEGVRRLTAHLSAWLGAWPEGGPQGLVVVASDRREEPGWDGQVRPVVGVHTGRGAVLSVPPAAADDVRALGADLDVVGPRLADVLERPGWHFACGVLRWSHRPAPLAQVGEWLDRDDERVPSWLHPFNGDVLVALVEGEVAAGVGRKQHDALGHELAVVTEEAHRGRGLAAALVAQAGRRVLDDGAVPTYLHAPANAASAATAERSGFPDEGWQILGLFGGQPG